MKQDLIDKYLKITTGDDYFHFNPNWEKYSLKNKYWWLMKEDKNELQIKLISYDLNKMKKSNRCEEIINLITINKKILKNYK